MADALSRDLNSFLAASPRSRAPILAFLQRAAAETPAGASVLDVGSGDAPYRELFTHVTYTTCDWEDSAYNPEIPPDILAPADDLPLEDACLDAIICTQVLEHVREPKLVLGEFHRVLKPGASLWLTAPLTWYLHEQPFDYFRYTSHGLRYLLEATGFSEIVVEPQQDSFSTLAQLVTDLGYVMGHGSDGFDDQRDLIDRMMAQLSELIGSFSGFDTQWVLPLNYAVTAKRPGS